MRTTPTPHSKRSEEGTSVLITGAGGLLGVDLTRAFRRHMGAQSVHALGRGELDICDSAAVRAMLARLRPAVVLNAAGYTNVDRAETEREAAFRANVTGTAVLAEACESARAKLVHFSTDQVFDGKKAAPHTETEATAPLNYYAWSKLEGEREALKAAGTLVLRVQWLYGEKKNRFQALFERKEFFPFNDQYGAPTWTLDLANVVVELVQREAKGIFHFAYDDYASWADVFAFVKAELGLPVKLIPRTTEEANLPAARPRFSVLSNRKLAEFLGRSGMGSWKDPLRRFLKQ